MDYTILGTRGSLPVSGRSFCEFGGATTCILLRMAGETIVVDAGTGILNLTKVLTEKEKHLSLIFSHTHADHVMGLGMCTEVYNPEFSFDVYGKTRDGHNIEEQINLYYKSPIWPVGTESYKCKFNCHELENEFMIGKVKVQTLEGLHPDGVSLLKFEADGECAVFASDCTYSDEFLPKLSSFAKNCDVLFADGTYTDSEWENKKDYGHSSMSMAAKAGVSCNAKKTLLIHYDPKYTDNNLKAEEKELTAKHPDLEFGKQQSFSLDEQDQLSRVLEISNDLSAERDREKLLSKILDTAMEIANCDAGTLYLLEDDKLHFCRMVTKSMGIRQGGHDSPITMPPVPLDEHHISSWVAIHNKSVNIPNIRESKDFDFSGTIRYDEMTGYHTQGMLVVPLTNDRGELIGVMQLLNAKNQNGDFIPFDENCENTVYAVASQAAISITNMAYSEQVAKLLDSLVGALSTAIDERTPYNANHTRNMVKYGSNFLDYLDATGNDWAFDEDKRRTFLLSVWLHDVGKLVVPLEVMDKATRLGDNYDKIKSRIREQELLTKIDFLEGRISKEDEDEKLQNLSDVMETIEKANSAGYLIDPLYEKVQALKDTGLLTDEEFDQICVRKGTLTQSERVVMESHVVVTGKILKNVSFPKRFANVPTWAAAHHELLNGKGYPEKKTAKEIPNEVRLLTILDVFEALTAKDRPYKAPMPAEKALSILHEMAEKELSIDPQLLKLFEESKAWEEKEE